MRSGDELETLAQSCNQMLGSIIETNKALKRSEEELRKHHDHLEELVEERTAKLQESEQRLKLALQGGNLGLWDVNMETGAGIYDERWAEMLGYSLDEIEQTRQAWINTIHPDDRERVLNVGEDYRQGILPEYQVEYRAVTKQGRTIWLFSKGAAVEWDDKGSPLRMVGTVMDITERKKLEKDLQDQATILNSIFDNAPIIMMLVNDEECCEQRRTNEVGTSQLMVNGEASSGFPASTCWITSTRLSSLLVIVTRCSSIG